MRGCRASAVPATAGTKLLADLFRDLPTDRPIVIVGENDRKEDGLSPGRDGALSVARGLAAQLSRPIQWALPPADAKDVRDWLTATVRGSATWDERGRELADHLTTSAETIDPSTDLTNAEPKKKPSSADLMVEAALAQWELWRDDTYTAFASRDRHTLRVQSREFKLWLAQAHRESSGRSPNAESLSNARTAIEAEAVHGGRVDTAHVRVAGNGGRIYLHLADDTDAVIEIDRNGWRECDDPPVRFRRTSGIKPLPMPQRGGQLDDLRRFVNCPGDDEFALVKAWITAVFRPAGPFPVLGLLGEQGSGKTSTGKVLKQLIDPSAAPVRSEPKEVRDLMIAARGNWVIALDNLSRIPEWFSDSLCRLCTGGGFATRQLYTDEDE